MPGMARASEEAQKQRDLDGLRPRVAGGFAQFRIADRGPQVGALEGGVFQSTDELRSPFEKLIRDRVSDPGTELPVASFALRFRRGEERAQQDKNGQPRVHS